MTPRVVLVGGTWSFQGHKTTGEWYQAGSPFVTFLEARDVRVLSKDRPFLWTSRVNGLFWQRHRHLDWDAGGANLACYLDPAVPHVGLTGDEGFDAVITHSHGLQVALYAATYHGARIPLLVDVAGPVRLDMEDTARQARPAIQRWVHIASDWSDKMQWFGEWFDGSLRIRRSAIWKTVHADVSIKVPGVGHSALLREPEAFVRWDRDVCLFDELQEAAAPSYIGAPA